MRALKIVLAVVVLASGAWGLTAWGLRSAFTGWFHARAAEGWQAEFADVTTGGYPLRHRTVLAHPVLADPRSGVAWRADWLAFESPAIWPGRQSLSFAETPQRLSYFDTTRMISAQDMVAALNLAPGVALELRQMGLKSGAWSVAEGETTLLAGAELIADMQQLDAAEFYEFTLSVPDFTPGARLRRLMRGSEQLPESFDTLAVEAVVQFDAPWDRRALEERRPQPLRIDLRLAEAAWGPLKVSLAGAVDVGPGGVPEGQIAVRAEHWREMLSMAEAAGAVPSALVQSAERGLGFLAGLSGRPETLDIRINLTGGMMAVGPVPLGPAPRLILR